MVRRTVRARPPARAPIERVYAASLRAQVVAPCAAAVRAIVLPAVPRIVTRADSALRLDEGTTEKDELIRTVSSARIATERDVTTRTAERMARARWQDVERKHAAETERMLGSAVSEGATDRDTRAAGRRMAAAMAVDPFGEEPWLEGAMAEAVAENVALIKSIPEQFFDRLEQDISRWVRMGMRHEEISARILARYGSEVDPNGGLALTRRRADLIAVDQVGKFYARLDEKRHEDLGIVEYIWRTMQDERVRGPGGIYPKSKYSHREREGKRYRNDKPPPDGHPGIPVRCRCYRDPVIEGLEEFQAETTRRGRSALARRSVSARPARRAQRRAPPAPAIVPIQPPRLVVLPPAVPSAPAPVGVPRPAPSSNLALVPRPGELARRPVVVPDAGISMVRDDKAKAAKERVVIVDVGLLDQSLAREPERHVGPGGNAAPGRSNAQRGKLERAQEFIDKARADDIDVPMPRLNILPNGEADVLDGRHRIEALRRRGVVHIPVSVPAAEADAFRQRFGVGLTRVRPQTDAERVERRARERAKQRAIQAQVREAQAARERERELRLQREEELRRAEEELRRLEAEQTARLQAAEAQRLEDEAATEQARVIDRLSALSSRPLPGRNSIDVDKDALTPEEIDALDAVTLFTHGHVPAVRDPSLFSDERAQAPVPGLTIRDERYVVKPTKERYEAANRVMTKLAKAPTDVDAPAVFRGLALSRDAAEALAIGADLDLGEIVSFSRDDTLAIAFADERAEADPTRPMRVVIAITRPKRGTNVERLSFFPNEMEFVTGGRGKISRVQKSGDSMTVWVEQE